MWGRGMKIEYMHELRTLANTLNFSKAAKELGISQPVLSTHIKAVEKELGLQLFDRDKHSVKLTAIGNELLPAMNDVVASYDVILEKAENARQSVSSKLGVGYLYNAYRRIIPDISRKYTNAYPDVKLSFHSHEYLDVTRALLDGNLDIALSMDIDISLHEICEFKKIGVDRIFCVVRHDDPIASYDKISLCDLRGEPLLLPDKETSGPYTTFIEGLLTRAGVRPNVSLYYQEIDTRYLSIESGDGIGLVGGHFRPYMNEKLKFIPITESYCQYDFTAIWKKSNRNENIPRFIEYVENEFKQ